MANLNAKIQKAKDTRINWEDQYEKFDKHNLKNPNGRVRTVEENRLILLSLKLLLKQQLIMAKNNIFSVHDINWTELEFTISVALHVRREHVTDLRKTLLDEGCVLEFGHEKGDLSIRGSGSPNAKPRDKLSYDQLLAIVDEVDACHNEGKTVTNPMIRNFIRMEFGIEVSERTVSRCFQKLGLSWKAIKNKKRNVGMYRMDLLREYLIEFNNLYKEWIKNPEACERVPVFTDESYIYQGHCYSRSYVKNDSVINKKSSKGQRLIMMHAITPFGPLAELDDDGYPVDDLVWTGDTPHSKPRNEDSKLTCENMWKASSSSGDYHDNMNSKMFLI